MNTVQQNYPWSHVAPAGQLLVPLREPDWYLGKMGLTCSQWLTLGSKDKVSRAAAYVGWNDAASLVLSIDWRCTPKSPFLYGNIVAPGGAAAGCATCGLRKGPFEEALSASRNPLPWLRPAGCACDAMAPAGQAAGGVTAWWGSEPIRFTGKNYVVGALVGAAAGALGMHLYMGRNRK